MKQINQFMQWSIKTRAQIFDPLLKLMTAMKIKPNHITFLRFWGGPAFVFLFPVAPQLAVWMILAVSLFDWFDGALARYQKIESDRGKFWDVLVDHTNYVFPVFALLLTGFFSNAAIGYHLLIVPVLYLLATIKESEGKKTDWLIRPYYTIIYFKPIALIAVILYAFWGINYINETMFWLNVAMSIWTVYYAVVINARWSRKS